MTCLVRLEIREILLPRLSFASKLAGASREPGCHQICSGAPIASVGTHIVEGRTVTFVPRSGPTYSVGTHVLWRNLRPLSGPTYSVGTHVLCRNLRVRRFRAVCIRCNQCRATAAYANVGFGQSAPEAGGRRSAASSGLCRQQRLRSPTAAALASSRLCRQQQAVRGRVSCKRAARGLRPRSDCGRARRNPGRTRPRTHWECRIQHR